MSLSVANIFSAGREDKPEEAAELQMRADLMQVLSSIVRDHQWSQEEAAKRLGLNQPQVSAVMNWKVDKLSSKRLYQCLHRLGFNFKPVYQAGEVHVEVNKVEPSAA